MLGIVMLLLWQRVRINTDLVFDTFLSFIESLLPPTARRLPSFTTNVTYEFSPEPGLISQLFKRIERNKRYYGVDDWGLSQTT